MKQFTQVNNSKGLIGLLLGLKSRISTRLHLLTMLTVLMIGLFGVNEEAWGQTYSNNKWYSALPSNFSINTVGNKEIDTYPPLAGSVSFSYKYQKADLTGWFANFDVKIYSYTGSYGAAINACSGSSFKTYSEITVSGLNSEATKIKFDRPAGNTHNMTFSGVKVLMKPHIRLKSSTNTNGVETQTLSNFTDTPVEQISTDVSTSNYKTVQFRSFLTRNDISNAKITITCSHPDIFRLGSKTNTVNKEYAVGSNMFAYESGSGTCSAGKAGKTTNYDFKVYFYPKEAKTYKDTIRISDGSSTVTVIVQGKGVLNSNAISWDANTSSKKAWGEQVNANATATNTSYSGNTNSRPITYSIENGKESYVTIADGKITFNKAGAGQTVKITASQEANYKYAGASLTKEFTIKSAQTLAYNAGSVDVSVSADDKNTLNLEDLQTSHVGNGGISYSKKSGEGVVLNGSTFYATTAGSCQILASAASTADYDTCSTVINITVSKRTPTIVFATPEHIYSGNTLSNMAKVQYNGVDVPLNQVDFDYSFDNPSWFSLNPSNAKQIMVSTDYSTEQDEKLYVTTKATYYYNSVSDNKTYHLEVKKTPEFYLNGVLLDKNVTTNLNLEVDETATFTFDKITSGFQFPTTPSHFTYNSTTGVLTATVAGDETFFFNEPGDAITFQHQCNLHLYVRKHETELTTSLKNNDVWMVDDSVAESSIYELVNGDTNVPVVISSDKPSVIAKENGKWVAKGKGSAVLTIAQVNSDKWTGDTITRTINVNRYTPTFDWTGLPDTLNFNTTFVNPVRSTSDGAITYASNKAAVTVTNDSTTLHTAETADNAVTITVIQKPTYKYEGKTATKTVKVLKLRNHVKVEVKSSETYLAVRKKTEGDVSWVGGSDNAIRLGGSETGAFSSPAWNWNDKYIDVKFEGIPKTVSFTTGVTSGAATAKVVKPGSGNNNGFWYMIEYPEGESEKTIWTDAENNNPGYISRDLKPNTNKVRICYTGNFAGYVKNLKITERTELSIDDNVVSLDFGSTDAGSNATKKNFTFDWYNLNPLTLSIEGGDGKYSVSPSSISSKKDSFALNEPVEVSYMHTAGGTHNATLVISEGTTELKRIPLTGTTNKVTPAITWKDNLSPMSRGENVTDPAEAIVELVYTSSDSTVVNVEGNVLKPLKKGTATITASYDGSASPIYNSNSSTTNVLVTNLAVQHIHWTQTFTRLKWSDDPVLSEKNTPDFDLDATVSYYDPETSQEVEITDRSVTYTSGNEAVVKVLEGNKLHVVGQGNTTLTAHINGITDSLYEATVIRDVIVREPTLDCEKWVLENKSASMATEINSFSGVETVYDLTGEPGYLSFEAWREAIHVIKDWTNGNLFVAEKIGTNWHELTGSGGLELDLNYANRKAFDSIPMSREATQVKIYKKTGSTGIHAFSGAYVTLARYLELENTKNKKTHTINLSTTEAKPGVVVEKTFTVNYSNITDQLDVELKHGDKFSIVSDATIGNECGDKGKATVRVRFLSNDVDLYRDTLLVHNLTDTVYVYLSADVDRHHQQITWNPETLNLNTTDNVTFDATTSASAAGLKISYAVTAGSDVASVDAATGALTIIKDGDVTIEARCEGNNKYYDAEPVPYTFNIEKVTPTITKNPKASDVTLPATLAASTWTENGTASVPGSFAWTNPSTELAEGDVAYEVTFTPENTDWYNTATCMVAPHVSRATQTIDWSFDATEMYGNADYTFDATASSGLAVTYSSSKESVASVNDQNKLVLHKAGESVTITATQAGNETYLPVSEERTFTVLRWTPDIVELPVGGTMYVGRILSDASLTGGSAEVNGQIIQGSFNWEDANSATINVPGPATHNVIFVPQNANFYNEVNCGTVALTVLRYMPVIASNTLTADGIEFPLTLEHSHIHGSVTMMDYVHVPNVEVTGQVMWKEPSTILRPGLQTATALFVPDNNEWYETKEIPLNVQVTGGYVFNGDNDSTWTEEANWAGNLVPTGIDDPVLINENVEIKTEVIVGSLTIKEGVDVVVKDGGVLTTGNHNSEDRSTYGNLHVENGGQVILGEGQLQVNDFVLDAKLGDLDNVGKSGQVQNPATLVVNGNAYFDLALDPSGECSQGWYDFTVPFPVDALNGVTRFDNSTHEEKTIRNEVNYAIMDFSESRRLASGYGWKKFRSVMQPGQCYTITIDDVDNVYRFKKTADGAFNNQTIAPLAYTEVEDNSRGWNGLGNGTMSYINLSATDIEKVQVYSHVTNSYTAVPMDTFTYVVGSAYFVQAPSISSVMNYTHGGDTHILHAPAREVRTVNEFTLALTTEDSRVNDRFYISASEDATDTYRIGRELTKFGTPTDSKVAQVWTNAYGMQLCDVEMPLKSNKASTNLSLYAPVAGTYTLEIEKAPADATLYLTQNNRVIWNLTMSPYDFDLTKGTTEGYGLRIVAQTPQISTDIENGGLLNGADGVRKVLIDNVLYIVTPEGKMYDIVGKGVNF